MKLDDLILISVDDHVIEPADMFDGHVPEHLRDLMPKIVNDDGVDRWIFQDTPLGPGGLNAVVSWPKSEWDNDPVGFAEMRPGCYDVHERIKDMNANGVLAGMNFPTFPGFAGGRLLEAAGKNTQLATDVVKAYNDWHIDEWCAAYPGRFLPVNILPIWDVEASVAEVKRLAAKGSHAVSFPETPYVLGLPSFYTDHWDPLLAACEAHDVVLCLHIGAAFQLMERPEEAPLDQRIILSPQLSSVACTDLIIGGVFNKFPNLRVAMSEGGIGWIPFLLDRMDLHVRNQTWTELEVSGLMPSELFRRNFLGCFITNPSSLFLLERIGEEAVAWECDYPHSDSTWPDSPEILFEEFTDAGLTPEQMHKVGFENSARFFSHDTFAHIKREDATVGALRAQAKDVDVSETSRTEYRRRYELAQSAS